MADGHIFLSYSSADEAQAEDLVRQLEARGIRIWYAPRNVRPGTDYSKQLQTAIEQASAFVVIVSKDSNESDFVRAETEMAFSRRRPIFPVRYSRIAPAPGLALFLQLRHWTNAFGPSRQNVIAQLGRELSGIHHGGERGGKSRFGQPPDAAEEHTPSRAMIPLAAVGCGALLLCILLIVQADNGAMPNSVAANTDTVNTADNAASDPRAPVSTSGQPNMGPLVEAWMRYMQDTAPPLPVDENFYTDNAVSPANAAETPTDATTITNGANSVSGM